MPTTVRSFCKINLGLAIGPARGDGFHALTTCYQTLEAHDLVTVEARPAAEATIRITSDDARVPADARNTAWKMTALAMEAQGIGAEVHIHIEKRLPVQGGIGGGSANAAAALLALEAELARHGVAALRGPERLRIAAEVGSDVPLFLIGGAVLGVGRGEEVYPLPDFAPRECVLALPEVGVSTAEAYRQWDGEHAAAGDGRAGSGSRSAEAGAAESANGKLEKTSGLTLPQRSDRLTELSRALASAFCPEPPAAVAAGESAHSSGVSAVSGGLAGNSGDQPWGGVPDPLLALVRTGIENDFERVVFRLYPSLGPIKRILAGSDDPAEPALLAALCGSGSALFGLYGSAEAARAAEDRLRKAGIRALRTRTLARAEYWAKMGEAGLKQ